MLRRHWKVVFITLSRFVDVLAIVGTAVVLLVLKNSALIHVGSTRRLAGGLVVFGASYILLSSVFGYYRGVFRHKSRVRMVIAAKAYMLSVSISLAVLFLIIKVPVNPVAVLIFCLIFPVLFLLGKSLLWVLNSHYRKKGFGFHPSLIAGVDAGSQYIFNHAEALRERGYAVRGFIMKQKDPAVAYEPQYTLPDVERIIHEQKIDTIFIPSTDLVVNGYASLKAISRRNGIMLKVLSPQSRSLLRCAKVHDIAGISLTSVPGGCAGAFALRVKRIFDIIGASVIILLLSPLFLMTILLILIEDGRPIFYTQKRGALKGGEEFRFIKFRTMVPDAEAMLARLKDLNESDGALFKMRNDPRITRVGRYLRKFSIDELPQLFNVLKGDMSLVGPRPLPLADFEKVDASDEFWDAVKDRARVKPGMTGLWQVSGRSEIKFKEMILLDLYYVENFSLMFDLELLVETFHAVLFGKGAY